MSNNDSGDGKFVVVENGKRVGKLSDTQAEALKEAEKRRKLAESQGQKVNTTVKVNLFG